MKAFIRYLISSNIGEVASIFFTAALGVPEGLSPVQLLWVNLVTDGPPATALGFNPKDLNVMRKPPRRSDDKLISGWVFFRYMVIGLYVGFATVGIMVYWYVYDHDATDGHTLVSMEQLTQFSRCPSWEKFSARTYNGEEVGCGIFEGRGKAKASTLSLTVLVVIEMLNALNALSEDGSLLQMPPWCNPYLIVAMCFSIGIHMVICYWPLGNQLFGVVPLDGHDWVVVSVFSFPVILIDEILKFVGRIMVEQEIKSRKQE
jgi:Ca2+-transporting ATPase